MRAVRTRLAVLLLLCALLLAACLSTFAAIPHRSTAAQEHASRTTAAIKAKRANVPMKEWILINIRQKSLTLYMGTEVQKRYAIATGTGDTPTPIGTFRISNRFAGALGGFGTRFLGLNVPWGQFGIHGTNKPGSIGSNASHGCIRMYSKDAEELYARVADGAKVLIEGGDYGALDASLRTLYAGDRNSHVAAVQRKLCALGYYEGTADGIFGRGTMGAVKRAREALRLPAGDFVDTAFYRAIGLILFD
ncbi:MAG: L,D-transpeptidase family protein [Clostridia bacterium]